MKNKIMESIEKYSKFYNVSVNEKQKKLIIDFCLENTEDVERDVKRFVETASKAH